MIKHKFFEEKQQKMPKSMCKHKVEILLGACLIEP